MKTRTLLFTCLSLLFWTVAAAAAPTQKEHALKAGKKGEITLTQPTKVGDVLLQPDTYVVQQLVSGNGHFVRFIELKRVARTGQDTYTEADQAGEIKCRFEAAAGQINQTTADFTTEDGSPRITKIAIKGEDVLHVF